jgi:predicted metal-dependent enzyme (double-stranded beta helix superfamily)
MTLATLDAPVRSFFERLAPLAAAPEPDMPEIAGLLKDLAQDQEYFGHHIDRVRDFSGGKPIHMPERGPRLMIVHRLNGQMGAIHSHKVWVAIAPLSGVETHRLYDVKSKSADGKASLKLAEERHVGVGEAVTMTPPRDVHAHGHVEGVGDAAYLLILTGDNQVSFEREQYDAKSGTWRSLPPGDGGDWLEK